MKAIVFLTKHKEVILLDIVPAIIAGMAVVGFAMKVVR